MQFWIHLALVVVGIAYFLYSYIKEKKLYQLLFVIWIPLTLLTYVSKNKTYLIILGVVQLIFFVLVIYFLFRNPGRKKAGYRSVIDRLEGYGEETSSEGTVAAADPDAADNEKGQETADDSDDSRPAEN